MSRIFITNDRNPNSPHRAILDWIPCGEADAVSMGDLARLLGEDPRRIRQRIERARVDGNIIAGTDAGLFIPATSDELRDYVRRNENRIRSSCVALAPAKRLLREMVNNDENR